MEDDERGDRPKSTRTEVNIAAVADLVKNNRRIASRIIAESLNIRTTDSSDSERGFGKEKVVCTFCSTLLTPDQREDRVTSCQDIIVMGEANFF